MEFELSMIELYRGELQDLLRGKNEKSGSGNSLSKRTILEQITSRMQQELKSALLETWSVAWLTVGKETYCVNVDERSSRSHLVMTIRLNSTNRITDVETVGKLTLVDLAGSERQSKTGSSGDTLKEAQSINTSLSALGNVDFCHHRKEKAYTLP